MNKPAQVGWGRNRERGERGGPYPLGHIFGQVSLHSFFFMPCLANIFICQTVIESFAGFIVSVPCVCVCAC